MQLFSKHFYLCCKYFAAILVASSSIYVTGVKENLLLAHYSHFKSALEEAKNVPRIFSAYFENKMRQDKRTSSKCCHNI